MSGETKKTSDLTIKTGTSAGDRVVIVSTSGANLETCTIDVTNFLANTAVPFKPPKLVVKDLTGTPANSSIAVEKGRIWFDNNYIYVAVADNIIKRASLAAF